MCGVSWLHKVEWKNSYILFSFSPSHFPVFWKGVSVTCFQLALSSWSHDPTSLTWDMILKTPRVGNSSQVVRHTDGLGEYPGFRIWGKDA
jgi:hypothetical protein